MPSVHRRAITLALLLTTLFAGQALVNSLLQKRDVAWVEAPNERRLAIHPRLFSALSFGHLPSAVDWTWLKTMLDPAIDKVAPHTHAAQYYDLDLATSVDPAFFDAYMSGANLLAVIRGDPSGAIALLRKAETFYANDLPTYPEKFRAAYWGRPHHLPLLAAYTYLFELDDMPSAAAAFQRAAEMPGAPGFVLNLGRRFHEPGGQYEVALRLINFMIDGANERAPGASADRARAELERKRDSLQISRYLFDLNRRFQDFRKKTPRCRPDCWTRFVTNAGIPQTDPLGGPLVLTPEGRITSTTPRIRVFGLE